MSRAAAASFARLTHALGCAALIVSATACSHKTTARNYPPPPPATAARPGHPATAASGSGSAAAKNTPPGVVPTISDLYGYASWYGYPYHGRKTASGEVYDMYQMTAAHKTLPLGSLVRVTNQDNGREVEVLINDRGPFVEGRVIDLSYAAAKEIQMVGPGVALVKLSVLETINRPPAPRAPVVLAAAVSPAPATGTGNQRFAVQVGAFREKENADRFQSDLLHRYKPVAVVQSGDFFKVFVGAETSEAAAQTLVALLRRERIVGSIVLLP